jgi:uncharacterized membrane protein HdeD (DUF308 family)
VLISFSWLCCQTGTDINTLPHFTSKKTKGGENLMELVTVDQKKSSMWLRIVEIIAGIIIVVLAGYVIAYPGVAIATLILFLAIALIIIGIDYFIRVFAKGITGWRRLFNLILSALAIIIAAYVIAYPAIYGSLTLVYLLGLALLFAGIASAARGTAGSLVVGILGIIIGFAVIIFPGVGLATIVFLVAVFLVIFGLESIASGILGRWV